MSDLFTTSENKFFTEVNNVKKIIAPDAEVTLYNGFFSQRESDYYFNTLLKEIDWKQDKIKLYGKVFDLPRLTAWYGDTDKSYTYSGIPMEPKPWTKELIAIKDKIETESGFSFSSVLLNLYRNGSDSVSWHSDDEVELGANPTIASVSFGETRVFQMKHKSLPNVKVNIPLTHGSFLLMQGETQKNWKHQIPKTAKALRTRINLTFRLIV